MDLIKRINSVSAEIGLPTKKILDMFWFLKDGPVENNYLIRSLGVSKNVLNQVKQSLKKLFLSVSKDTSLNDKGKKFVKELFIYGNFTDEALWSFFEKGLYIQILEILNKHLAKIPQVNRNLDQFIATRETVAKRANLMNSNVDLAGKRILFLGDDDFTSVAVSVSKNADKITVLDIDRRILDGVQKAANEEKFEIETDLYDARNPLPSQYKNNFDAVFTDPPYTTDGFKMFLSRAVDALDKSNKAARVYICFGNSDRAKERFLPVYQAIIDSGLMVRFIFDKFNRYFGAESIGSASSLFILDVTSKSKPLITGKFKGEIYTNE